jgi:OOP family OmpA-OmpF porin
MPKRNQTKRYKARCLHLGVSAISVMLLTGINSVHAENSPSDRNFDNRWYVGAGGSLSWLKPKTRNTGFNVDDKTSNGGQIYLGFDLFKFLSIEGFYADQGEAGIASDTDSSYAGEVDYQQYGVSAIGYLFNTRSAADYSNGFDDEGEFRHEGWSAFGRVGLGGMKNDTSVNYPQKRREDAHMLLGAGIEYGWANGFATRAEFVSYDKDSKMIGLSLLKRFGKASPYPVAAAAAAAATQMPVAAPAVVEPPAEAGLDRLNVQFEFNKSDINKGALVPLNGVTDKLRKYPGMELSIEGHACNIGSEKYNQGLSERRSTSVLNHLRSKGIDPGRLQSKGFSERQPIADNATEEGRILNRRVEFKVLK